MQLDPVWAHHAGEGAMLLILGPVVSVLAFGARALWYRLKGGL